MKARFIHAYIVPNKDKSTKDSEKVMDTANDWIRDGPNVWLVYSRSELSKWYERLKPLAGSSGRLFICEIDPSERTGFMPKSFWEWLQKDRPD